MVLWEEVVKIGIGNAVVGFCVVVLVMGLRCRSMWRRWFAGVCCEPSQCAARETVRECLFLPTQHWHLPLPTLWLCAPKHIVRITCAGRLRQQLPEVVHNTYVACDGADCKWRQLCNAACMVRCYLCTVMLPVWWDTLLCDTGCCALVRPLGCVFCVYCDVYCVPCAL